MTKEIPQTPSASPLSDGLYTRKFVTVVYEIVDDKEWGKTNPLKFEHNGLKARTVCIGDLAERFDRLEELCEKNDIDIPTEIYDV